VLMLSSALLAIPPEVVDNPGLWEKIWFALGGAALGKVSLGVIILIAIGIGLYFMTKKA
jgi:hypothetical protein